MAENNDNSRGPASNGTPGLTARTWMVWIAVAALIPLLLIFQKTNQQRYHPISQKKLFDLVASNLVESGEIHFAPQTQLRLVRGRYQALDGGPTNQALVPSPWRRC